MSIIVSTYKYADPSVLTDNNTNTFWTGTTDTGKIDLGSLHSVTRIVVTSDILPDSIIVSGSSDDINWSQVKSIIAQSDVTVTLPNEIYYRYFRFVCTHSTGFKLNQIRLYGSRKVYAQNQEITPTAWSTVPTSWIGNNSDTVYADLGYVTQALHGKITWKVSKYPSEFEIQTSNNSYQWETVSIIKNPASTDTTTKTTGPGNVFYNITNTVTNTFEINQFKRYMRLKINNTITVSEFTEFKFYGKPSILPFTISEYTNTDSSSVSVDSTIKAGALITVFKSQTPTILAFINQNTDTIISVYPKFNNSSYSLDIESIQATSTELTIVLATPLVLDLEITVLASTKRIINQYLMPNSEFSDSDTRSFNIPQLVSNVIVVPTNINGYSVNIGKSQNSNNVVINVTGPPWELLPIRVTMYKEPYTFGSYLDGRTINTLQNTVYTTPQSFDSNEVLYKNVNFIASVENYLPIFQKNITLTVTVGTTSVPIPLIYPEEIKDGDQIGLDSSNVNVTFSSIVLTTRLEPVAISTISGTVDITITVYRRVSYENSIAIDTKTHDYTFINKQISIIDRIPNNGIVVSNTVDGLTVNMKGVEGGKLEFIPSVPGFEIDTSESVDVSEIVFNPFIPKKVFMDAPYINISGANIYANKLNINADNVLFGGGEIIVFTVNTTTSTVYYDSDVINMNGLLPGVYVVKTGSLLVGNHIIFDFTVSGTPVTGVVSNLVITGFVNTTVDIEHYVPGSGSVRNITLTKFVGFGENSSITINSPSTQDTTPVDMIATSVAISGVSVSQITSSNNIQSSNLFTSNNIVLGEVSGSIIINSKDTQLGNMNIFTDNLRVSMDKKYTLIDSFGNDVVVGKDVIIQSGSTNAEINIQKTKNSSILSNITIDTIPNVKNVYNYANNGVTTKIGTLTATSVNNKTTTLVLTKTLNTTEWNQLCLDKIFPSMFKFSDFGTVLPIQSTNTSAQIYTRNFKKKNITKVETYNIVTDSNITPPEEFQVSPGQSINTTSPLTSLETVVYDEINGIYSTYDKLSGIYSYFTKDETAVIVVSSVNLSVTITSNTRKLADITFYNLKIGTALFPGLYDGELELFGNNPVYTTENKSIVVCENGTFIESSGIIGFNSIHGTKVLKTDGTQGGIDTTMYQHKISSTYQNESVYDSFLIDTGIVNLTDDALLEFDITNGQMTNNNIQLSDIKTGTFSESNTAGISIINKTLINAQNIQNAKNVQVNVKRVPKIMPHGRHDIYTPPGLTNLKLSDTEHTESVNRSQTNTFDVKYIGPENMTDFYCQGIWYPKLKVGNTLIDTSIQYLSGNIKKRQYIKLAVNPFENKSLQETYGVSLLATTKKEAILNAGVSVTGNTGSVTYTETERLAPISAMSSMYYAKAKTIGDIDHIKVLQSMAAYTTLFDDFTDIESIINVLKTSTPSGTSNLRKALFDTSPIDIKFDKYVLKETSEFTIANNNWSRGLYTVGDKYVSGIRQAIMNLNGISDNDLSILKSGEKVEDSDNVSFKTIEGNNPLVNFKTSAVLGFDALIKETVSMSRPGIWIKTGNTVFLSADIDLPVYNYEGDSEYTISGFPFENLIRGTVAPDIREFSFNNETKEQHHGVHTNTPLFVPEYTLDVAESPFAGCKTKMNTSGEIVIVGTDGINKKYSEMVYSKHKFSGIVQIVDPSPDFPDENEYTIPSDVQLSGYSGYTLDDGGNTVFGGYKLNGSGAQFADGIYT